jgi:pimeloyl-ACP methyl ester carboxylesterase
VPRLVRDGVALVYDDVGRGSPPLLFVHGWACDHTYFEPQVAHFGRLHRTITVDLRGHGESDKPRQDYTMAGFADDLAWLCVQLEAKKPVVVGHSMGGTVALVLAAHHPALPGAIVLLDMPTALLAGLMATADPKRQTIEALHGPAYREAVRQYAEAMFLPMDDDERRTRIVDGMTATPQHVLASGLEQALTCDLVSAAAACTVPVLYIQATEERGRELERFRQLCPQLVVGRTVGAGHFHQLEVPDQVNAMIERFLAVTVATAAPRD